MRVSNGPAFQAPKIRYSDSDSDPDPDPEAFAPDALPVIPSQRLPIPLLGFVAFAFAGIFWPRHVAVQVKPHPYSKEPEAATSPSILTILYCGSLGRSPLPSLAERGMRDLSAPPMHRKSVTISRPAP